MACRYMLEPSTDEEETGILCWATLGLEKGRNQNEKKESTEGREPHVPSIQLVLLIDHCVLHHVKLNAVQV